MTRFAFLLAGLVLLAGVIAAMLTTTVPGDRGRDEVNLLTIHELAVAPEEVLTQPVPLQRPDPYSIDIPYRWRESTPARIDVSIMSSEGVQLSDSIETLGNSRAPFLLEPIADGSYWQQESAAFHPIRVPAGAGGTVTVRMTRVDHEAAALVLFASDRLTPTLIDQRPSLLENPNEYLDLQTEYGTPRPAWQKTSVYTSRLQSLAPPWLPFPVPEALLVVVAGLCLGFYAVSSRTRPR